MQVTVKLKRQQDGIIYTRIEDEKGICVLSAQFTTPDSALKRVALELFNQFLAEQAI